MPFLRRNAKPTLHYELDDLTDPWDKRPVVILQHGYGRSGKFWYRWLPHLCAHFRVVRPDWRGFGASPLEFDPRTGYSLDAMLEDIEDIVEAVGGGPVHHVGESFGGTFGLLLAARAPHRVRSVTLISSPMSVPQPTREAMNFGFANWDEALRTLGTRAWVAAGNDSTRFPAGTDPALITWYTQEMGKSHVDAMVAMAGLLHATDARPVLPSLRVPVLGLYPQSGAVSGPQQELIRTRIPGIRYVELDTRFHAIQFLHARECAREWLAFAESVDAGAEADGRLGPNAAA